jgi:hypothetical protein
MPAENRGKLDSPSENTASHIKKKMPEGKRWKPGQSGNPGGAPKGKRISTWMLELGEMTEYQLKKLGPLPMNGRIALARIRAAANERSKFGNGATDTILERTEGKVAQALTGQNGEPLVVQVVKYGEKPKEEQPK